ncbi:MAG: alpha/beta hydrolase [Rhizobiaceae bacterium]
MNLATAALLIVAGLGLLAAGATRVGTWLVERDHPAAGRFTVVNGTRMHHVHVAAGPGADLPPIVFLHGASGNLNDQMVPLRPVLEGRGEMLFVDRPGHGWSARGPRSNRTPDGQADTIAALMGELGIGPAIIVGHSFGGAVAASFALRHPGKTAGLLFLSPASHPWPGGGTSWYYRLSNRPLLGRFFTETLAWPAARLRMAAAVRCVFAPNHAPDDYLARTGVALVLRPENFRANAEDVEGLFDHVSRTAPHYHEIKVPTMVISGDRDTVVYEEIHSVGLARDIAGAELVWVKNLGHKPDWIARQLVVAAIARLAGKPADIAAEKAALEARIADDSYGPIERCPDEKPDFTKTATAR